ncbi:MAG TPA: sensor histidine kinase [Chitinophagaceae bacterium]|nr:sensor histidine kinase [Chitinophagaceae bacterium]
MIDEGAFMITAIIWSIILLAIVLIAFALFAYRGNQKKKLKFQQELLKSKIEIQEQTLQKISQEIHDNIGQVLSLVKLNLHTTDFSDLETTGETIQRSKELVGKAITDLRNLSKSLSPEMIKEIGLHETIQREIALIAKTGRYEAIFNHQGQPFRFDKQKELILYRIFQELLNNIINHARAKTVIVRLFYESRQFNLTVSDDGKGFDDRRLLTEQQFGLGIRNMQNRASLIGATFQLTSTLGKGTTVSIDLPLEKNNGPV